jgi:hypothetical protein
MPLDLFDDDHRNGPEPQGGRPFIGVYFECCGLYARIYRDREAAEYAGRCPKCLAMVRASVGPGGTTQRIFRAK